MHTHVVRPQHVVLAILANTLVMFHSSANEPMFVGLGDLEGGAYGSFANSISSDGSTIVGSSQGQRGGEAFVWRDGKMTGLGTIPGGKGGSEATGVSADGSVVVGVSAAEYERGQWRQAFRWTKETGMQGLGDLGGGFCDGGKPSSIANAVSADGKIIVGTACASKFALNGRSYSRYAAFRWTADGGMQSYVDFFDDAGWARCLGVSADGSVAIGIADDNFRRTRFPVLWTGDDVTSVLPRTRQARSSMTGTAFAISDDGTTVAGVVAQGRSGGMFIWQALTGMKRIDSLTFPRALTKNGKQLVGELTTKDGDVAVIWDAENGVRQIADVLSKAGVKLDGWKLIKATDITPDGAIVIGHGKNPDGENEAWMARIR